jgi:hypothetical protein
MTTVHAMVDNLSLLCNNGDGKQERMVVSVRGQMR